MSYHLLNPSYKPHTDLGEYGYSDTEWDALKLKLTDYLAANATAATIDVDVLRALDDDFDNIRVWNQITSDLGLTLTIEL